MKKNKFLKREEIHNKIFDYINENKESKRTKKIDGHGEAVKLKVNDITYKIDTYNKSIKSKCYV